MRGPAVHPGGMDDLELPFSTEHFERLAGIDLTLWFRLVLLALAVVTVAAATAGSLG